MLMLCFCVNMMVIVVLDYVSMHLLISLAQTQIQYSSKMNKNRKQWNANVFILTLSTNCCRPSMI